MAMVSVRIRDLSGAALDWAVAKCEGYRVRRNPFSGTAYDDFEHFYWVDDHDGEEVIRDLGWIRPGYQSDYSPSTKWHQGGPIIEREGINVERGNDLIFPKGNEKGDYCEPLWLASCESCKSQSKFHGTTSLIAAMRCYVASKADGDSVMIPEELIND